ncbi:MAG TPA: response regulator [Terriglobales bacterium]|nr:response regulator [Terriglobales bacterium]
MSHILIVDDEPGTSWALAEGLSDDGFTIDTFSSAEDAWRWLQTHHSDLVISDLRLPGMSGLDFARRLARSPHRQPLIMVTAYGSPETLRALEAAGAVRCFPKPFPMDQLRRAVREALHRADVSAARRAASRRAPRSRRKAA